MSMTKFVKQFLRRYLKIEVVKASTWEQCNNKVASPPSKKENVTLQQRLTRLDIQNIYLKEKEKEYKQEIMRLQNCLHKQQTEILSKLASKIQMNESNPA